MLYIVANCNSFLLCKLLKAAQYSSDNCCRLALGSIGLGPKYHLGFVKPDGRQMKEVARLLGTGQLKAVIAKIFPLEEAA